MCVSKGGMRKSTETTAPHILLKDHPLHFHLTYLSLNIKTYFSSISSLCFIGLPLLGGKFLTQIISSLWNLLEPSDGSLKVFQYTLDFCFCKEIIDVP